MVVDLDVCDVMRDRERERVYNRDEEGGSCSQGESLLESKEHMSEERRR
jgi:hypothetical protein